MTSPMKFPPMKSVRYSLLFGLLVFLSACTQGPRIASFSASDTAVTPGTEVTLSWSASNFDRLTINPSIGNVEDRDSATVRPNITTTYELTAEKGAEQIKRTVEVRVGEGPEIERFTISPNPVSPNAKATLSWKVNNANTIEISDIPEPAGGFDNEGSVEITATVNKTYQLTAENDFGTDAAPVELFVDDNAIKFSASPNVIEEGDEVTLSWAGEGLEAATLAIDNGVGNVTGKTSIKVTPSDSTLYKLTVTDGSSERSALAGVVVGLEPVIFVFEAGDTTVSSGAAVTLNWIAIGDGPVSLELDGEDVTGSTSTVKNPNQTTTYELTATNDAGSVSQSVTVNVGAAPTISSFSADKQSVTAGDTVQFSWNVSGATTLTLTPFGNVSGSGQSVQVNQTTTYKLTASNEFGSSQSDEITVTAAGKPTITKFSADPPNLSPSDLKPVTLEWNVTGEGNITVEIDNGVGSVNTTGTTTVQPTQTTTYTLTASSEFGTSTQTVTVTILSEGNIVLLIAGQSNASGRGELNGNRESSDPDVRMLGNDYNWKTATEPTDSNENQKDFVSRDNSSNASLGWENGAGHSFGVRLGKKLNAATSKKVYLIPSALAASCVDTPCSTPVWEPGNSKINRGELFGSANYRAKVSAGTANNAPASPEGGAVSSLIWYQGESDQNNSGFIEDTNKVMDTFMFELDRQGDSIQGVPVFYMQLAQRREDIPADAGKNIAYHRVREKQRQMETQFGKAGTRRDNYYMVVTHDLPLIEDNHLSAEGQKILGDRIALAYREHILGEGVDGTGPRLEGIALSGNTIKVDTTKPINNSNSYDNFFTVFVDGSSKTINNGISNIRRDLSDNTAVLITLSSAPSNGALVTVRYMSPNTSVSSYPTAKFNNVVKSGDLPLPAFGPLTLPFSAN